MPSNKTLLISKKYGLPFTDLIKNLYVDQKLSAAAIADKFFSDTGIPITPRPIHYAIKHLGISRQKSDAFKLAIQTGRKSYTHLRKPVKSRELRRGISTSMRYKVLQRDSFKCVLCGHDASETILTIDHIRPVLHGGTNTIENLRVLCRECNTGKMIVEHEK